jgi:acyl-CoA dehydrogenase
VTGDYGLASAYATERFLRIADGPDEVHRNQIARIELKRHRGINTGINLGAQPIGPTPGALQGSKQWRPR